MGQGDNTVISAEEFHRALLDFATSRTTDPVVRRNAAFANWLRSGDRF
jgi:hypothetical protein